MVGGKATNTSLFFGSSSEKASRTFVVDYFDREAILGADRYYTSSANQKALRPNDPYAGDGKSSSGFPVTIAAFLASKVNLTIGTMKPLTAT
jgi:hypothetical protein